MTVQGRSPTVIEQTALRPEAAGGCRRGILLDGRWTGPQAVIRGTATRSPDLPAAELTEVSGLRVPGQSWDSLQNQI